jgi:hypothetical protein
MALFYLPPSNLPTPDGNTPSLPITSASMFTIALGLPPRHTAFNMTLGAADAPPAATPSKTCPPSNVSRLSRARVRSVTIVGVAPLQMGKGRKVDKPSMNQCIDWQISYHLLNVPTN